MRINKPARAKKSAPRSKKSTRFTPSVGQQAAALTVIGVVAAAAMLFAASHSSPPSRVAAADFQLDKTARAKNSSEAIPATGGSSDTILASNTTVTSLPLDESQTGPAQKSSPVTITGCLEGAGDGFRLKDANGTDAPKARSWKSGFLKKSSPSIEVVDAANRLQLPTHVGQRVSVTGVLVDREMKARSLKRIATSCNVQVAKL